MLIADVESARELEVPAGHVEAAGVEAGLGAADGVGAGVDCYVGYAHFS